MKVKDLVLSMTYKQVLEYIEKHPKYKLPTFTEAQEIEKYNLSNHIKFWTSNEIEDRQGVYYNNSLHPAHRNFKFPITLVLKENAIEDIWELYKSTNDISTKEPFELFKAGYEYGH